jgi:hypothetical protein
VKSQDHFGKKIELTFDRSDTVKTKVGGCCSIILKAFILAYLFLIVVGFIFSPDLIIKFQEEFKPVKSHSPLYEVADYEIFPVVKIMSEDLT